MHSELQASPSVVLLSSQSSMPARILPSPQRANRQPTQLSVSTVLASSQFSFGSMAPLPHSTGSGPGTHVPLRLPLAGPYDWPLAQAASSNEQKWTSIWQMPPTVHCWSFEHSNTEFGEIQPPSARAQTTAAARIRTAP